MKKFFMVIGVLFVSLIAIGAIAFFFFNNYGSNLDEQSKAYVNDIVPKIVAHWDVQEAFDQSSPQMMAGVPKDKVAALFKMFSHSLGDLKEYKGAVGDANVNYSSQGKIITASYLAKASFEKGDAAILIKLILNGDKWQLITFNVNSTALILK